jgi:hypothetical protein
MSPYPEKGSLFDAKPGIPDWGMQLRFKIQRPSQALLSPHLSPMADFSSMLHS